MELVNSIIFYCALYYFVHPSSGGFSPMSKDTDFERPLNFLTYRHESHNSSLQYITNCLFEQWKCRNGECIDYEKVCDGSVDCSDRSDESQARCEKMRCSPHLFRCTYGGCVSGSAKCNGIQDCADNSDELHKDCQRYKPTNHCGFGKFQCNSLQCISEESVCDGHADCLDSSDETVEQCGSNKCPLYLVQCAYGACIDRHTRCNNVIDCVDKSDEDPLLCEGKPGYIPSSGSSDVRPESSIPVVNAPHSFPGCVLPLYPNHGSYVQLGCGGSNPGTLVTPYNSLLYSCKSGYYPTTSVIFCLPDHTWSSLPECKKMCFMVKSSTVDFTCFSTNGKQISCRENISSGTVIHSKCKNSHYSLDKKFPILTCNDGIFDNTPSECIQGYSIQGVKITIEITSNIEVTFEDSDRVVSHQDYNNHIFEKLKDLKVVVNDKRSHENQDSLVDYSNIIDLRSSTYPEKKIQFKQACSNNKDIGAILSLQSCDSIHNNVYL